MMGFYGKRHLADTHWGFGLGYFWCRTFGDFLDLRSAGNSKDSHPRRAIPLTKSQFTVDSRVDASLTLRPTRT